MLALPITNSWGFIVTNQDNGSTTPGTSVVPGASDAEGSWTEIIADAAVTTDLHYGSLFISGGNTSATVKSHLLDFGWDPAGGTSYVPFFENYACGGSNTFISVVGGTAVHFPCRIPSGSALAVRVQGVAATAGTVRVLGKFCGKPSRPELFRPAAYAQTLGYTAGTLGTSFTPGNAAWGAWASLGSTTKRTFWAQLGIQIDNTTVSAHGLHAQLGIGDGTDMHVICDVYGASSVSEQYSQMQQYPCEWEIPSGATLYVRGNNSAAPVTGYNATAVLFGG